MNVRVQTKQIILLTAERLFAEFGIDAVSIRQISKAAGQRNNYALQYHYGDRDTLINEILTLRAVPINQRRLAMLADIEENNRTDNIAALAHAFVWPLAEHIILNKDSYYLRFLLHLYYYRQGNGLFYNFAPALRTGFNKVVRYIRLCLVNLPTEIMDARLSLIGAQLINAMALWEENIMQNSDNREAELNLLAANLEDVFVGSLQAPMSEQTRKQLVNAKKPSLAN